MKAVRRLGIGDGYEHDGEPRKTLPRRRLKPKRALAGGHFQVPLPSTKELRSLPSAQRACPKLQFRPPHATGFANFGSDSLRVIEALRLNWPLTQAQISRETGLSRTTISTIVQTLRQQGLIESEESNLCVAGLRGRRATLSLKSEASRVVAESEITVLIEHLNHFLRENTTLHAENALLKSTLAVIQEMATTQSESFPTQMTT